MKTLHEQFTKTINNIGFEKLIHPIFITLNLEFALKLVIQILKAILRMRLIMSI